MSTDTTLSTPKLRAVFALRETPGSRETPELEYWVLLPDEQWSDVVRGDGHSYRPGGPDEMVQGKTETDNAFFARARHTWAQFTPSPF